MRFWKVFLQKNSSRNKPRDREKGEKKSSITGKDGLNKTSHLLLSPPVLAPLYGKEFQKCSGTSQHYLLDRLFHYAWQYLYICTTLNCLMSSWLGGRGLAYNFKNFFSPPLFFFAFVCLDFFWGHSKQATATPHHLLIVTCQSHQSLITPIRILL